MARKFGCNSTGDDVLQGIDLTGKQAVVTGVLSILQLIVTMAAEQ